jgi:hypothetical protein
MSKINATLLLLYADGVVIAAQKGCSINVEQDLPDASNKQSSGWAEHINGLRNASVDFDALFSTTGISAGELMDYIIDRSSLLLAIVGGVAFPMVAEVDVSSIKIDAPEEQAMSLSGSLKVDGAFYQLKGTSAQLVTDPDGTGTDYDTLTISGIAITSAINLAGTAYCHSNTFSITSGDVVKVAVFLTSNSGELPTVELCESGGAAISNVASLVAGLNIVTLTATDTHTAHLSFRNSAAANWSVSSIYAFKYVAS